MSLSIYHTHNHSLGRMSERGEALSVCERETEAVEIILLFLGFNFGTDSISEEFAGFSLYGFLEENICVYCLLCLIAVLVILSVKYAKIMLP